MMEVILRALGIRPVPPQRPTELISAMDRLRHETGRARETARHTSSIAADVQASVRATLRTLDQARESPP
jgi:hypothetical protein